MSKNHKRLCPGLRPLPEARLLTLRKEAQRWTDWRRLNQNFSDVVRLERTLDGKASYPSDDRFWEKVEEQAIKFRDLYEYLSLTRFHRDLIPGLLDSDYTRAPRNDLKI